MWLCFTVFEEEMRHYPAPRVAEVTVMSWGCFTVQVRL